MREEEGKFLSNEFDKFELANENKMLKEEIKKLKMEKKSYMKGLKE